MITPQPASLSSLEQALTHAHLCWQELSASLAQQASHPTAYAALQQESARLHERYTMACQELGVLSLAGMLERDSSRDPSTPPLPPLPPPCLDEALLEATLKDASYCDELSLSPQTSRELKAIQRVLADLSACETSRQIVEYALRCHTSCFWQDLSQGALRELLHYLVAVALAWTQEPNTKQKSRAKNLLRDLFSDIRELKHSREVSFIHGMSLKHVPAHTSSWKQEAEHWVAKLEARVNLPAPQEASRRARKRAPAKQAPVIPDSWPWLHHTEGRKLVIVGGVKNEQARRRLERELRCTLEWVECEKSGTKNIERLHERIDNATLDMVLLLKRYIGHNTSPHIASPASRSSHVKLIWVEHGYGIEQIKQAIESSLAPRPV